MTDNINGQKRSEWGERVFQVAMNLVMTALGFALGLWAANIGYNRSQRDYSVSVVRALYAWVSDDLSVTAGVADSLKTQIESRKFTVKPYVYEAVYHPAASIPFGSEIGCLDLTVAQKVASYEQMLRLCEDYRQTFIRELANPQSPIHHVSMFMYYTGLENVVSRAEDVLAELNAKYPDIVSPHDNPKRPHYSTQLAKIIEDVAEEKKAETKESFQIKVQE